MKKSDLPSSWQKILRTRDIATKHRLFSKLPYDDRHYLFRRLYRGLVCSVDASRPERLSLSGAGPRLQKSNTYELYIYLRLDGLYHLWIPRTEFSSIPHEDEVLKIVAREFPSVRKVELTIKN